MYEQEEAREEAYQTLDALEVLERRVYATIKNMVDEFRKQHGIDEDADDKCLLAAAEMATQEALWGALESVRDMAEGFINVNEREYDKYKDV